MSLSTARRALLGLIVFVVSLVAFAQQAESGPSLEETIEYINSHGTTRNAEGGKEINDKVRVSLSTASTALLVESVVEDDCVDYPNGGCTYYYSIPFRLISVLRVSQDADAVGQGAVGLSCPDDLQCIHEQRLAPHAHKKESRDAQRDVHDTIIAYFDDADQGVRLVRAVTRLMYLVSQRYVQQNQQKDANDPFK
jgi:hypothetical protein